jgi:hypothetical protein
VQSHLVDGVDVQEDSVGVTALFQKKDVMLLTGA